MEWYYVQGQEQVGPISPDQLRDLVAQGLVKEETLVWNSTLPNWQPYGQVVNASAAASAAPDASAAAMHSCVECGRSFPPEHLVAYEDHHVCAACKPVFFQRIREGGAVDLGMDYAGFWIRFAAILIDGIIMSIPMMIFVFMYVGSMFSNPKVFEDPEALSGASTGIFYLLIYGTQIAYTVFFLGRYGATPGKMLLGIKVVRSDGSKITYLRAFGRYFANQLSGLILYIGYIMAAFDDEKRALHDYICDTRVIRK